MNRPAIALLLLSAATIVQAQSNATAPPGNPPPGPSNALSCPYCKLQGKNYAGMDLTDANLTGADLTGADFTNATLKGALLIGANLTGAKLDGAKLGRSSHGRTKLTRANLTNASLKNVQIADADFQFADLSGATFNGSDLTKTRFSPTLKVAAGSKVVMQNTKVTPGVLTRDSTMDATGATETTAPVSTGKPYEGIVCAASDLSSLTAGFYISNSGNDGQGCGTLASPCLTWQGAQGNCPDTGGCALLFAADEFVVRNSLVVNAYSTYNNVYGGCAPTKRAKDTYTTLLTNPGGQLPVIQVLGAKSPVTFANLEIVAQTGVKGSALGDGPSIAVLAVNSGTVSFPNTQIVGGVGAAGRPGGPAGTAECGCATVDCGLAGTAAPPMKGSMAFDSSWGGVTWSTPDPGRSSSGGCCGYASTGGGSGGASFGLVLYNTNADLSNATIVGGRGGDGGAGGDGSQSYQGANGGGGGNSGPSACYALIQGSSIVNLSLQNWPNTYVGQGGTPGAGGAAGNVLSSVAVGSNPTAVTCPDGRGADGNVGIAAERMDF